MPRDRTSRRRVRFEAELEDHFSERYAREALNAATEWGHYAERFAYDDQSKWFSLEDVTVRALRVSRPPAPAIHARTAPESRN